MEVHAHTHTPRKKWTHYLWEFLMLFLAVFCGFLAEYQLEHTIEHNREREFMRSMIDDLEKDTATLFKSAKDINKSLVYIDSFIMFYALEKEPIASKFISIGIYIEQGMISHPVFFTDRTSMQLKNAGGMRLIRNKIVADSLIGYWNNMERIQNFYDLIESYRLDARKVGFKIFNHRAYRYVKRLDSTARLDTMVSLLNDSPQMLGEYVNFLTIIGANYRITYLANIERQIRKAEILIDLIRKKYHFE